jgi:hypothetical protein
VDRYDLLGESLGILFGIADQAQAESIITNYPVGPFGPPVVWPQEKSVPIYHNQAIWPFVTAYWIKAAQKAKVVSTVDAGIQSLKQAAALNLSNMENCDFVTGLALSSDALRKEPAINSRRQLWSVAAYLSMVQDTVFGLDTTGDGIRFQPFITAKLRNDTFGSTDVIELKILSIKAASTTSASIFRRWVRSGRTSATLIAWNSTGSPLRMTSSRRTCFSPKIRGIFI